MNPFDVGLELNRNHPTAHVILHRLRNLQHSLAVYSVVPEAAFVRSTVREGERSAALLLPASEHSLVALTVLAESKLILTRKNTGLVTEIRDGRGAIRIVEIATGQEGGAKISMGQDGIPSRCIP